MTNFVRNDKYRKFPTIKKLKAQGTQVAEKQYDTEKLRFVFLS